MNFDSRATEENDTIDSLTSSINCRERVRLSDIEKQPDHVAKVLKKFLRGDWDNQRQDDDFLTEKILLEFPVFALNDDYIRSLANIIFMKLDSVRNMIN